MDAGAVGNTRAKVESELARVQNSLAVTEEARQKTRLAVWPTNKSFSY